MAPSSPSGSMATQLSCTAPRRRTQDRSSRLCHAPPLPARFRDHAARLQSPEWAGERYSTSPRYHDDLHEIAHMLSFLHLSLIGGQRPRNPTPLHVCHRRSAASIRVATSSTSLPFVAYKSVGCACTARGSPCLSTSWTSSFRFVFTAALHVTSRIPGKASKGRHAFARPCSPHLARLLSSEALRTVCARPTASILLLLRGANLIA